MSSQTSQTKSVRRIDEPPDGGYGWIIVIATGIIGGFIATLFKSPGIIYDAILQRTSYTRAEVASAAILPRIIATLFGIVGSKIAEVYSFKFTTFTGIFLVSLGLSLSSLTSDNIPLFTLTFGLITGFGCGFVLVPSTIINGVYFTKRRSIAMALSLSIAGASTFFMPLLQILIDEYGLNGALLLWGGIVLHGCIPALLLRQPTWTKPITLKVIERKRESKNGGALKDNDNIVIEEKNINNDVSPEAEKFLQLSTNEKKSTEKTSDFSVLRGLVLICRIVWQEVIRDCRRYLTNYVFILLLCNRLAFFFTTASSYLILPQFAYEQLSDYGVTPTEVAFLLSVMSIGEMISRLFSGCIINVLPNLKKTTLNVSLIGMAVSMFSFQFVGSSYIGLVVLVTINGVFTGFIFVMVFVIIFDLIGTQQAPGAHALQQLIVGTFTIAAGPLMAKIRDISGSYVHCWNFLSGLGTVSVLLWILEPIYCKRYCAAVKKEVPEPKMSAV